MIEVIRPGGSVILPDARRGPASLDDYYPISEPKRSEPMKPGVMYRHRSEDGRTAKLIRAKPLLLEVVWPDGSHLLLDSRDCVVTLDDYYPISENRPSKVASDFDVDAVYSEMMQCADKVDQYGIRDLDACVRLGTLVVDLNNWMRNGGQPPKEWDSRSLDSSSMAPIHEPTLEELAEMDESDEDR